jgi:thiamine biosynthesis lipoprotein
MLSNYDSKSEWSEVNRGAGLHPVVSHELFQLLAECMRYSRESEGAFDITVGPLMKTWGSTTAGALAASGRDDGGARAGRLPARAAQRELFSYRAGVELDPGGIGKGYAVDRTC